MESNVYLYSPHCSDLPTWKLEYSSGYNLTAKIRYKSQCQKQSTSRSLSFEHCPAVFLGQPCQISDGKASFMSADPQYQFAVQAECEVLWCIRIMNSNSGRVWWWWWSPGNGPSIIVDSWAYSILPLTLTAVVIDKAM